MVWAPGAAADGCPGPARGRTGEMVLASGARWMSWPRGGLDCPGFRGANWNVLTAGRWDVLDWARRPWSPGRCGGMDVMAGAGGLDVLALSGGGLTFLGTETQPAQRSRRKCWVEYPWLFGGLRQHRPRPMLTSAGQGRLRPSPKTCRQARTIRGRRLNATVNICSLADRSFQTEF